ncbi:MAG: HAMP domain-containing protein [Deltaproteobacteria bacterium]|nr:HAMP domain-containing protein [Deltaproteobacteria bacterium]
MKRYLIFKLLAINLLVIAFVMVVIWLSIDTLAAGYFVTLMEKYHISPEPSHEMFVGSIHRYLIWTSLSAAILAVLLSFVMTRRALSPLTRMTIITREIAAGNFDVRVPATTKDEVGQLARAFNRMAESLDKLEKLRRSLMIDVAHELRTPLTNMRGYLEALSDGVLPVSRQNVSLLQDETLRLAQLVEDVLQLARADAVKGRLALAPTDLTQLIRAVSETVFSRLAAEKKLTVTMDLGEFPVVIPIDGKQVNRVIRNIADNAARYTPENGAVVIRAALEDDSVKISFTNTSRDVKPEDLPFLFERFYRGEKSRSREHGGAGIGLSIVKELVEAHGGTVGASLADETITIWFKLSTVPSMIESL